MFTRTSTGKRAGHVATNGYVYVFFDGRLHLAHRLAWLYMTGQEPPEDIDHKDRDRTNNRWSNLRLATRSQNLMNKGSSRGFKNIYQHKSGRFRVKVKADSVTHHGGYFATREEAAARAEALRAELHGEFAHG